MSYKSRGNWALGQGISRIRWDKIFGRRKFCQCGIFNECTTDGKHCAKCEIGLNRYSTCCNWHYKVEGRTTKYYVCLKCKKACDIK